MKVFTVLFVIGFLAYSASAQDFEYGKPEELKGLVAVYVDTHGNLKDRDKIVQEISEANLGLKVVESKQEAEVFIDFSTESSKQAVSRTIKNTYDDRYSVNVTSRVIVKIGDGRVTIKGKTSNNPRVVMSFNGGNNNPAAAFVKDFIKAYKKANSIK
jgi:hypothetical protein